MSGLGALGLLFLGLVATAAAQELRFFRIGTGSVSGTYFPIGGLIADIISHPPGARPCEEGGGCGVPGLIAIAQTSQGSIDNIEAIERGDSESGFAQSDVTFGAFTGTGVFAGRAPATRIRALANLYPESVHLVVRTESGIAAVRDLAGKRVSLDRGGSGTRVDALLILDAFGLEEADLVPLEAGPADAVDLMEAGELDAFFLVAGYPAAAVAELTQRGTARLLPLVGEEVTGLIQTYPFFSYDLIPFGTYRDLPAIETISVGAQWLVSSELEEEFVYRLTRALWRPEARELLDLGHAKGREITLETALDGVAIPLHPGAERYYREVGLLQ
ncbi:MAG TPA: TAXI family TRAP transporter solute-binding subunit [Geminicoccaceae bacterium]|nr:TAXI family TRAP transporter solute-binding subunit [Geminicoccaceae bacterium]